MQALFARTADPAVVRLPRQPPIPASGRVAPYPRIAFLFNAQAHQMLHGITVAEQLALGWKVHVDILTAAPAHLELARRIARPDSQCRLRFELIGSDRLRGIARRAGSSVPPKLLTLWQCRRHLDGYDAIALPERTSTIMRAMGVKHPRLIHIDHGAGDRAAGFDPRIARFDFALVAGEKQRRRMLAQGLIRADRHAVVGYPKFEAADRARDERWRPFADDRPIILYNPHFSMELGSWSRCGPEIARRIASHGRFNLIVAPHVRMCDSRARRAAFLRALEPLADLPNVHVDPGSERSIDMTYTMMADLYLGDVSSQIYEFLRRPRPCLFVNADRRQWQDDPDHAHWRFGPVLERPEAVVRAIDHAFHSHADFREEQRRGFEDTFGFEDGTGEIGDEVGRSRRAAAAIAQFMNLHHQV